MSYKQALKFLYDLEGLGIKLGLENITNLLDRLGNPQNDLKIIHIAGTNGKGSTAAMILSILKEAGFKVGMYTSPHLKRFGERIQINGEEISKEDVVAVLNKVRPVYKEETFFEVVTAMAFLHFKEQNVDFAVMEVGMGGRLDATNVGRPLISIITNISLEHTKALGSTIKEIAGEKAGIIKENGTVITAAEGIALEVIKKICEEKNADLKIARLSGKQPGLLGDFQRVNAGIAIKTIKTLNKKFGTDITKRDIVEGLKNVKWPGRLDYLEENLLVDCAHNPAGAAVLAQYLRTLGRRIILVTGICDDKDIGSVMGELVPLAYKVILTKAKVERAADPKKLAKYCKDYKIIEDVKTAVDHAKSTAEEDDLVVVAGSIFVAGELY